MKVGDIVYAKNHSGLILICWIYCGISGGAHIAEALYTTDRSVHKRFFIDRCPKDYTPLTSGQDFWITGLVDYNDSIIANIYDFKDKESIIRGLSSNDPESRTFIIECLKNKTLV